MDFPTYLKWLIGGIGLGWFLSDIDKWIDKSLDKRVDKLIKRRIKNEERI